MPTFKDILEIILPPRRGGFSPADTPEARRVLNRLVQLPGNQGDLARALHLGETPIDLEATFKGAGLGETRPNFFRRGFTVNLNPNIIDSPSQLGDTVGHEGGHAIAAATGLGGQFTPSGIAPIDLLRSKLGTGVEGGEVVANRFAGIPDERASQAQQTLADVLRNLVLQRR